MCNPGRPTLPDILYPTNGLYVPASSFNLTYYGSGQWGTVCNPVVDTPFYEVSETIKLILTTLGYALSDNGYNNSSKCNSKWLTNDTSTFSYRTSLTVQTSNLASGAWFWLVTAFNTDLFPASSEEIASFISN